MSERKVVPLRYEADKIQGISSTVMTWHHDKHYAGYVNFWNTIQEKLKTVDRSAAHANWSDFGELKRRETFNANGSILHEVFFDVLGGDGKADLELPVVKRITADFGSVQAWKEDFIASAKIALGWAMLTWDPSINRLYNYTGDTHNQGGVWGATPIIPIDVFEHAYYHDFGPDRAKYIEVFLNNLDWKKINEVYEKAVR